MKAVCGRLRQLAFLVVGWASDVLIMIDAFHALFDSSCNRLERTLRFVSSDGDALNQAIQATEARCDFHKCTSRRSAISCEVHAKFKCWEAEPARPDGLAEAQAQPG